MMLFVSRLRHQVSVTSLLFILILLIGITVRVAHFPGLPPGFNQDEASSGYEAWSLAETGKDRWGKEWPAYFEGWGSGQNVLESYLMIPVVKALGLSIFSTRLVPLLLGIFSLPLFYYCLRPLGRYPALLGLFFLAVVPWHFMLSRWALESNLAPFCMLLGCAMLLRALRTARRRWIITALVPFALALYAYGTTAVVLPVFLLLTVPFLLPQLRRQWPYWLLALGLFLLVAFPFLVFFAENYLLKENLAWTDNLFFSSPLLPSSRLDQVTPTGGESILHKNLPFLMSGFDDGTHYNVLPGFKPLLSFTILLTVLGLLTAVYRTFRLRWLDYAEPAHVVVLLFTAWALASIVLFYAFELNVNRFNHMYLPCLALSVWIIDLIIAHFDERVPKTVVRALVVGWFVVEGGLAVQSYFKEYAAQSRIKRDFSDGLDDAFAATQALWDVDQVKVTGQMPLPYVYTLFFTKYPPAQFQQDHTFSIVDGLYRVERVGKYSFDDKALDLSKNYGYLGRRDEYQDTETHQKTVFFTNDLWEVGVMNRRK